MTQKLYRGDTFNRGAGWETGQGSQGGLQHRVTRITAKVGAGQVVLLALVQSSVFAS